MLLVPGSQTVRPRSWHRWKQGLDPWGQEPAVPSQKRPPKGHTRGKCISKAGAKHGVPLGRYLGTCCHASRGAPDKHVSRLVHICGGDADSVLANNPAWGKSVAHTTNITNAPRQTSMQLCTEQTLQ